MNNSSLFHNLKIGRRMIKTTITVFLCFLIFYLRGESGTPFYSTTVAILCMQPNTSRSTAAAGNNLFGTFVGAVFGSFIIFFDYYDLLPTGIWYYVIVSLFIIPIIKTCVTIKRADIAYLSCVVFISIVATHITGDNPVLFVLNRTLDTLTGIVLALAINSIHLPRKTRRDILFVPDLEGSLLTGDGNLSSYSLVELNAMLDDGANITISTERTPAAMLDALKDLHLELPVIAMNGAALYDLKDNRFVTEITIPYDLTMKIVDLLDSLSMGVFITTIIQDVMLIYIIDIKSMEMQKLYRQMRISPYRNFIYAPLPEGQAATYIYSLEKPEIIEKAASLIQEQPFASRLRVITGEEPDHPDSRYLKIYNCEATRDNMIRRLADKIYFDNTISLGNVRDKYDIYISDIEGNETVRTISRLYKPYAWERD